MCEDDYTIIADGEGLIEIRNAVECEGFLNVCCIAPRPTTPEPLKKSTKRCGLQNDKPFPWSSTLLYKQYPNFVSSYKCRVSLIHPKIALTAAHCLQEKGFYQVKVAGSLRTVANITMHPSFKWATFQNDIAVLILNKPFNVERVSTVCLPPPGSVLDGINCTTATSSKEKGKKLEVIGLSVVAGDECVEKLRKSRLGASFELHESFVCTRGVENDTCAGDGGSPLICPVPGVPGRYQQAGIASWGIGCGDGNPGMYTNLAHLRDWIDEVVVETGLDASFYRV
ncbi:phenoloxidase-activating factor 2-like [Zophobas morio]|uniref:phenoloxidase-activating factor 2-like n=1 Tax=Zophobas morio TaxID=2755281 RepID=UPI003082C569